MNSNLKNDRNIKITNIEDLIKYVSTDNIDLNVCKNDNTKNFFGNEFKCEMFFLELMQKVSIGKLILNNNKKIFMKQERLNNANNFNSDKLTKYMEKRCSNSHNNSNLNMNSEKDKYETKILSIMKEVYSLDNIDSMMNPIFKKLYSSDQTKIQDVAESLKINKDISTENVKESLNGEFSKSARIINDVMITYFGINKNTTPEQCVNSKIIMNLLKLLYILSNQKEQGTKKENEIINNLKNKENIEKVINAIVLYFSYYIQISLEVPTTQTGGTDPTETQEPTNNQSRYSLRWILPSGVRKMFGLNSNEETNAVIINMNNADENQKLGMFQSAVKYMTESATNTVLSSSKLTGNALLLTSKPILNHLQTLAQKTIYDMMKKISFYIGIVCATIAIGIIFPPIYFITGGYFMIDLLSNKLLTASLMKIGIILKTTGRKVIKKIRNFGQNKVTKISNFYKKIRGKFKKTNKRPVLRPPNTVETQERDNQETEDQFFNAQENPPKTKATQIKEFGQNKIAKIKGFGQNKATKVKGFFTKIINKFRRKKNPKNTVIPGNKGPNNSNRRNKTQGATAQSAHTNNNINSVYENATTLTNENATTLTNENEPANNAFLNADYHK